MDKRVKQVLKDHGIVSVNSEKFRYDNHEMNNEIIFYTDAMLEGCCVTKIVGYNEHPSWNERDDCVAVMFEDKNGKEFWCHVPKGHFEPWNIGRIFHDEELENDESGCDLMWD